MLLVTGNKIAHKTPSTAVRGARKTLPQKCEGVNIDLCNGKLYRGFEVEFWISFLEIVSGGETFFLYDGENVIIEKANGRISRNIYAGPLFLRLDGSSKAYEYLYNAHGDVVALVNKKRYPLALLSPVLLLSPMLFLHLH